MWLAKTYEKVYWLGNIAYVTRIRVYMSNTGMCLSVLTRYFVKSWDFEPQLSAEV